MYILIGTVTHEDSSLVGTETDMDRAIALADFIRTGGSQDYFFDLVQVFLVLDAGEIDYLEHEPVYVAQ